MKSLIVIFAIIASSVLYVSCGNQDHDSIVGITLSYPELTKSEMLKAVRTDKNDISAIIDTINVGELNSSNNYSIFVELEDAQPNYIVYVENTQYIDTISDVCVGKKCRRERNRKFQYKFNGCTQDNNRQTCYCRQ